MEADTELLEAEQGTHRCRLPETFAGVGNATLGCCFCSTEQALPVAPVALPHWDGERLSLTFPYHQALAGAGMLLHTVFTEVRLMQLARSDGQGAEDAALFVVLRCSLNDTEPLGARAVGLDFTATR